MELIIVLTGLVIFAGTWDWARVVSGWAREVSGWARTVSG